MKNTKQKGFSLVELLIAIAVISFGVICIYMVFLIGIKTNKLSKDLAISYEISNREIEAIRNLSFQSLTNKTDGSFYSDPSQDIAKLSNGQARLTIRDFQGNANIKEIIVRVTWTNESSPKETVITTLIANEGTNP